MDNMDIYATAMFAIAMAAVIWSSHRANSLVGVGPSLPAKRLSLNNASVVRKPKHK